MSSVPHPQLMGILNVTHDSFYDGGRYASLEKALKQALLMEQQGADILDIGGESSRPGALALSEEEEVNRVIPLIETLKGSLSIPISIDTTKATVAKQALEAGAAWINDINGFTDPAMQELAASSRATLCLMHMQGEPRTMQVNPTYPEGVVETLIRFFEVRIDQLLKKGVKKSQIVIDPGIGFGKTVAHNGEIIENLPRLKTLGFPVLLGVSRKSFLQKILHKTADQLLSATLTVNVLAITHGVDFIRVHDIQEHRDLLDVMRLLKDRAVLTSL